MSYKSKTDDTINFPLSGDFLKGFLKKENFKSFYVFCG